MATGCGTPQQLSAVAAVAHALSLESGQLAAALSAHESGPRFVRFVDVGDGVRQVSSAELSAELGYPVEPCAWLPGLFVTAGTAKLHDCSAYAEGRVAGIDAGSAAAAFLLDPRPGEAVLDLCCAPGSKLLLLSQLMRRRGWLCGVDVSRERLGAAATVLRKHRAVRCGEAQAGWRVQLFCADGTHFLEADETDGTLAHACRACPALGSTAVLDSWVENVLRKPGVLHRGLPPALKRRQIENAAQQRLHEGLALPCACITPDPAGHACVCPGAAAAAAASAADSTRAGSCDSAAGPFDRVLVDAECTHDGSTKHLAKFGSQWGWDSLERRVLDPGRLAALQGLQRGLLSRGFRLLRPGGVLIYSTCSLTAAQNEDVVGWLLETHADARLVPIDPAEATRAAAAAAAESGVGADPGSSREVEEGRPTAAAALAASAGGATPVALAAAAAPPPAAAADPLHLRVHRVAAVPCEPSAGSLPGALRFSPLRSGGVGGLFVARLTKESRGAP